MGWFNRKFVYDDKIFDKHLSKIYSKAYELRQEGDYISFELPDIDIVKKQFEEAKIFIETVRKEI